MKTAKPMRPSRTGKVKSPSPQISARDQKILWSRAAGRCSKNDCRKVLTIDTDDGSKTLGEMCHIIGEKKASPRGKIPLSEQERNSYSNLILLCAHHHKIIDRDSGRYPVEVLHSMKDAHEQWVEDTLGAHPADPDDIVYSSMIDSITLLLDLGHWWWFVDNAVRDLVPSEFIDVQAEINRMRLGAVWPEKEPKFKLAIINLLDAYDEYVNHYLTSAAPKNSGRFYGPDKSYRQLVSGNVQAHEDKEKEWSDINFWLLCNLTLKLNVFAEAVRNYSNPLYFRTHGLFLIHDSIGYRFEGQDTLYKPTFARIKKGLLKRDYSLKSS